MIKRKEAMRLRVRNNISGGTGTIKDLNIFEPEEMLGKSNLFSKFFISPACSIGLHAHTDDAAIYYLLEGELIVSQNGEDYILHEGDAVFTANGDSHGLANQSEKQAVMLAIIFS